MPRIEKSDIARLKEEISLVRLVEASGVRLEKRGKDFVGCCPFHDDKTPSLVISPDKNLWNCLGACGMGGDVIEWVKHREGISFRHAVELLQNDYDPVALAAEPVKRSTVRRLDFTAAAEDQKLLSQVIDYYHKTLKQSPEALDYLKRRGLAHPELIETFRLGFANRTLGYRLPQKNRKAGAEVRARLQALGLLRSSGHEHFSGSLVIPVLDMNGQVSEVYGRKITDGLRKGTPKHLYFPGPHKGVFNCKAVKASEEIILCESLIDALTFWCAGYRHVTASFGTGGFTDEILQAFCDHKVKRVLIAYDRDAAGNEAADKLAARLQSAGMDCYRVLFPGGMDANQYAREVQPAPKSLGLLLKTAQWMGKGTNKGPTQNPIQPAPPARASADDTLPLPQIPSSLAAEQKTPATDPAHPLESPADQPLPEASPVPPGPTETIEPLVSDHEITFPFGERSWRVRGLKNNMSYESLKLNILVRRGDLFHVDGLDLYSARQRAAYINQAARELGLSTDMIKGDLGKLLLKLEALQEEQIRLTLEPATKQVVISVEDQQAALALLKSPDLMDRLVRDVAACGVVGEAVNVQTAYLAAVSRKLDKPLAILIQSTSAAGKSALMDAILDLMPEEERVQYSAMTGQSLFYLGNGDVRHKILAIAEEEGVREAAYALKLLQSQGELTIASTGKDPATGKLVTQEYQVEGPVMLMLTTTAIDLDEELKNRCLVLSINETREQTRHIHDRQRFAETLEGLLAERTSEAIIGLHRNAQRLLRPLKVVNPYAERLTFLDDKTRTRRDHQKYLTLIRSIALLHQYQRPIRTLETAALSAFHGVNEDNTGNKAKNNYNPETGEIEAIRYIEVTLDDIACANRLAHEVLGRTLDELPPQTRCLLDLIRDMVVKACKKETISQSDYRFSRREVREAIGWGNTQLKTHLKRLEELEYLLVHRGGRGQSFVYELAYNGEGEDGGAFVMKLLDVEQLKQVYDKKKSGVKSEKSGSSRGQVGPKSGGGRTAENPQTQGTTTGAADLPENPPECIVPEKVKTNGSYPYPSYAHSSLAALSTVHGVGEDNTGTKTNNAKGN